MTGEWPMADLDHRHGVRVSDRWGDLRLASQSQNSANSKTHRNNRLGLKGVRHHAQKYQARIAKDGKPVILGSFDTPEAAHAAYAAAAEHLHGEFARAA